jgi:hypothetical protein
MAFCAAAAVLPIAASAATATVADKSVVKKSAPSPIAAKVQPQDRVYIVYVITTESRIPKRYVFRAGNFLSTASPERMFFNQQLMLNGFRIVNK